ncbi:uncharacterized protein [Dysidea avara]|uniref:uncharacterized protein n=1 Tax=Dysidea avara TaxID=196820 RepID=UPI003318BC93
MALSREEAFTILGLEEGSTEQEIKEQYKKLALKWHPDKQTENINDENSTKKFQQLSAAYKKLTADEDITPEELADLFQQIFNCPVTITMYEGTDANIIIMNTTHTTNGNGVVCQDATSDTDPGTTAAAATTTTTAAHNDVSTDHGTNDTEDVEVAEKNAEDHAAALLQEEQEKNRKTERRRAKNKKKKEAKKRKKHNPTRAGNDSSSQNGEKDKPTEHKQNYQVPSAAASAVSDDKESDGTMEDDSEVENGEVSDNEDADMNSAFFARATQGAMSKLVGEGKHSSSTREDGRSDSYSLDESDPFVKESRDIAKEGNMLATNGEFKNAIEKFTEAITLYPNDQRYFGNRSFCYDLLGEYDSALIDACEAVRLSPTWAKGYLRKGRALYGLKQYEEAEKAYQEVLKLDSANEDALKELYKCHTLQLMLMGFSVEESEAAARKHTVMAHAIDDLLAGKVETPMANGPLSADYKPVKGPSGATKRHASDSAFNYQNEDNARSLWIGNVNPERVTESQLAELFGRHGRVVSVRILPEKHCAFVNYENAHTASSVLNALQGYYLGGGYLLIRYPDNPKASMIPPQTRSKQHEPQQQPHNDDPSDYNDPSKKTGPVNGNECYFWRTTGCHFGRKCHYKHIPQHRGIDRTATMVPKPRS